MDRLVAARAKLLSRLETNPEHELASRWETKIAEYEESLRNFQRYGQEVRPTGRPAVVIDVPLDELGITAHEPGS